MLKINLLYKASTFAVISLFASVVITPCLAMEELEAEKPAAAPLAMKEEEKPAPTPQLAKKTPEEMDKEAWEEIQKKISFVNKETEEKLAPLSFLQNYR